MSHKTVLSHPLVDEPSYLSLHYWIKSITPNTIFANSNFLLYKISFIFKIVVFLVDYVSADYFIVFASVAPCVTMAKEKDDRAVP